MGDDSDKPLKDEPTDRSELNTDQRPGSYRANSPLQRAESLKEGNQEGPKHTNLWGWLGFLSPVWPVQSNNDAKRDRPLNAYGAKMSEKLDERLGESYPARGFGSGKRD